MASGTTHFTGGLIGAGVAAAAALGTGIYNPDWAWSAQEICILAAGTLFGSMYPDTDIKSLGSKFCYSVMIILAVILLAMGYQYFKLELALLGTMAIIPLFASHRGLVHDAIFLAVAALAVGIIVSLPLAVGFFFGAIIHLLLDS